uniref:sodium transporter HKT1-like n=1 Tax=Erigeron canadensis TaxID=72917 RepID=UPI001CB98212|nr:sodium transporter HKT1-like [Erigeron canadensis]
MTNPHSMIKRTTNLFMSPFNLKCCSKKFSSFVQSIIHLSPFTVQVIYFIILSLFGFVVLKSLDFKTSSFKPKDIDLFFTTVSALTVSSMSTVDMEVFSNNQLILLMFLMFMGGEIFVSMVGLHFRKFKHRVTDFCSNNDFDSTAECSIELGITPNDNKYFPNNKSLDNNYLMHKAIKSLGYVVLCYILVVHFIGFILVYIYISFTPSARDILINKGLNRHIFSLFTIVSTFANCGFVPTNENMTIFKKNSGLLLILIPQILLGSTLYPVVLRATLLVLTKITKRDEFGYMLKYSKEIGYGQLLSSVRTFYLAITVFGLILVQLAVFCSLEWHNIDVMEGLSNYEKMVGSFFQVVNTRYAGEAVFDLSKISPAILVGFIVMMYFPSSTTYMPVQDHESKRSNQRRSFVDYLLFSRLSYLVIFIILICVSEKKKMHGDPINFSVLNIAFEVFSAYGNVGLSTCYSCQHQIKPIVQCKEEWYGFAGRWSNNGKYLLIMVMFFGRLKNFTKNGGKYWNAS